MKALPLEGRSVYVTYQDGKKSLIGLHPLAHTTYQFALNDKLNPHNTPESAMWNKYEEQAQLIPITLDENDKKSLIEIAQAVGGAGIAEAIFFQSIGALSGDEWTAMCKENGIKLPEEVE